ncbi:MAG: lysine 2,3-aminomutase [Nitriliruptorales bacterium]|nr:lysine 2,3-aminomutase [Nitriliruptorales bacterium]
MGITSGARLAELPQLRNADPAVREDIRVVSTVLPFRVNRYVVDELIDWDQVPDDPIYRLTFPHRDMLPEHVVNRIRRLLLQGASRGEVRAAADEARRLLNPHPGEQLGRNVPTLDGRMVDGLQHKYRETVLVFPAAGQTCHAYCGYCFRWAQFVDMPGLRLQLRNPAALVGYLRRHRQVSDVLFTGGDPLVMATHVLRRFVEPLLDPQLEHVRTLRFGTKALSFWPYRFLTDPDADDLLDLIEGAVQAGRHVAVMAHFSHPRELETRAVAAALRRLQDAGAVVRAQAPLVNHVNADAATWAELWRGLVALSCVPYYLFVERDTGAKAYFQVPLARALQIYRDAVASVSGLERTARGPVMSTSPGKVVVDGEVTIYDERVFALRFLQGRNPTWVGKPFYAAYDDQAAWLDELKPAFGATEFFFVSDRMQDWRQPSPPE